MKTELNRVGKLCDKFRFYYILDEKKKRPDVHGFALLHCADFVNDFVKILLFDYSILFLIPLIKISDEKITQK